MKEYPSMMGQRFGMLLVERQVESTARGQRRWLCCCDCGNEYITTTGRFNQRPIGHCGCFTSPDMTGRVFRKLTILGKPERQNNRGKNRTHTWECICTCGNITYKDAGTLKNPDECMCQKCAGKNIVANAQANAGYVAGTQITKKKSLPENMTI